MHLIGFIIRLYSIAYVSGRAATEFTAFCDGLQETWANYGCCSTWLSVVLNDTMIWQTEVIPESCCWCLSHLSQMESEAHLPFFTVGSSELPLNLKRQGCKAEHLISMWLIHRNKNEESYNPAHRRTLLNCEKKLSPSPSPIHQAQIIIIMFLINIDSVFTGLYSESVAYLCSKKQRMVLWLVLMLLSWCKVIVKQLLEFRS